MKKAMFAIVKKDLRGITASKRLFFTLLIVPFVLTIFIPTVFVMMIHFIPEEASDFQKMLELIPMEEQTGGQSQTLTKLVLNSIMPVFFLIIPIMTSSVMAASSFAGEKEKHTLETLLYCPLSLKQIFISKIMASFSLSMIVSFLSFFAMIVVLETEIFLTVGGVILPDISWAVILLLLSPAVSLIAITLIVRGSAKAQTVEEAQQGAVFLILPLLLLVVGQFTGVLLVGIWILSGLSLVSVLLALLLIKNVMRRFSYEILLK